MATASRRLTRKDIRQPDKFITVAQSFYDSAQKHRFKIFLAAGAVAVAVVVFLGWRFYVNHQNALAGQEFSRALTLYRDANYQDAIPAFQKVETYGRSHFYPLALLYQTNSYFALKDIDKAIETGRRLVGMGNMDSLVRQSALVSLAAAEEQKGLCKEAIEHYAEAERIYYSDARNVPGPLKDKATLGKARCSAQLGDAKGAIAAYREYLKQGDRELTPYVSAQIAELEAKATAQPTGK
ncbi:MAG: tetratricopeptide repeat protein [Candidatus Binatia bacterium]